MQRDDDISQVIRRLRVPASADLDERVHSAIREAQRSGSTAPSSNEPALWALLTIIMKTNSIRYTLATALGFALIAVLAWNYSVTPVWAMEQAIEALQKYRAVCMTGYTTVGGNPAAAEFWARANVTGTRSDNCLAKSDNWTAWVEDNKTYVYDHARNTVIVDSAVTMGMNPWLGPRLLATLAKMPDYKAIEGDDPATGQKRILVTGSIESAVGPQSFAIEFDAGTKLPVSMKHWRNLDRKGPPDFAMDKIVYFEDLPDSALSFDPPAGVLFETKPLTIPEANLPMLSNSDSGMPVDEPSRDEACRTLLQQFWTAVINQDLPRIRQLCPLTASWPERLLLDVMSEDEVVELLQIGDIEQKGQSPLGLLALVPSRVRCADGKVREIKIVVQFRETEQGRSCVIHGNYGYTVEVE